ncbi:Gp37 family protein [Fundidesulfovibrio putealis]|uniref:Gp37 family protein n=1 Tax=Fundidesulfovibrio putealis TaxID=270496 RepID=UPI00042077C0|nr:Gp37 family protein [Fundidesulfovibrio putealis]
MIKQIEDAILARLKAEIPGYEVRSFPEKPGEFRLTHPKGAVLVAYSRGTFGRSESTDDTSRQQRRMEFDLFMVVRNLREHGGAYDLLDAVRLALTGWGRDTLGGAFFPVSEGFQDAANGVWTYRLTMAVIIPAQALETDLTRAVAAAPTASEIRAANLGELIIVNNP